MEICRFYTSKNPFDPITLDEYISRMAENQSEIFYFTGNSVEKMLQSPEIEGFLKRDIDVILLTDSVDDFWITVVLDYKDKKFKSISNENIQLDEIKKLEISKDEDNSDGEIGDEDGIKLISYIKTVLGDKVQDVVFSKKLVESPACLGLKDGQMNSKMEKFLIDQKQLASRTQKILEINKNHSLIKKMSNNLEADGESETLRDAIKNLFDFVCIIADEPLGDSNDFSLRVAKIINNIL